jgi:hypothetical protein
VAFVIAVEVGVFTACAVLVFAASHEVCRRVWSALELGPEFGAPAGDSAMESLKAM